MVAAHRLKAAKSWWEIVNESVAWQDGIFDVLTVLYGIVAAVALVQLVRIQLRMPEYGWTTQKVFHILNFFVDGGLLDFHILLDLPTLAFFTTCTLLVLFWAEGYDQAGLLRGKCCHLCHSYEQPYYFIPREVDDDCVVWCVVEAIFFRGVFVKDILCRFFLMLQRFPVESREDCKKLNEVGYVTIICYACFLARCIVTWYAAFNPIEDLEVLDHPILNFIFYLLGEILSSSLVLFILRKLPSRLGIVLSADGNQNVDEDASLVRGKDLQPEIENQ